MSGSVAAGWCVEARGDLFRVARQRDPGLDAEELRAVAPEPAGVRSECAMPRPAVIQFTAPGSIACSVPSKSRCAIAPSKRYVTVARPICGCGRTSSPLPSRNSAGPIWSKKMNGPDHLAALRRQRPSHLEAAEVGRLRHDYRLDGGARIGIARNGILGRLKTHDVLLKPPSSESDHPSLGGAQIGDRHRFYPERRG